MHDSQSAATQTWKNNRWIMWFLIVVVTAGVLLKITLEWHRYDLLGHFGAAVFAVALLVFPWRILLMFKKGLEMEREQLIVFAYMLLMLSTSVFDR